VTGSRGNLIPREACARFPDFAYKITSLSPLPFLSHTHYFLTPHLQKLFYFQITTTFTMPLGVQPYLAISAESGGAKKAIAWYKKVFGAQVKSAMACGENDEKIGHAELVFGANHIFVADNMGGYSKTPDELGGTPITLFIQYPKNSKVAYDNAVREGATVPAGREYKEQPWGWSAGTVVDPFGYQWTVGEDSKGWSDDETGKQLGMKNVASEF
jgi:PhnB protein